MSRDESLQIGGQPPLDGSGVRVALATARFNGAITRLLAEGARKVLLQSGCRSEDVEEYLVPGAFELPVAVRKLAESGRFEGIVALGCVIRGETPHFDYVAGEAAAGLARVAYETLIPVGFGLLTCDTVQQAQDRAGGRFGNKGEEAAKAVLEVAALLRRIEGE